MDGAWVFILIAVVVNILATVFGAGKLWQKVKDLSIRISKLEERVENSNNHLSALAERLARLEGKFEVAREGKSG